MFSGFQSNAFQTGFQIVRSGVGPTPVDQGGHYYPEDIRKWKKYLKELKEYQQSKIKKKRRKRSRSVKEVIQFDPSKFPTAQTLEKEILLIEQLIAQRIEILNLIREQEIDDEEAAIVLF